MRFLLLLLAGFTFSCAQPTEFNEESLQDTFVDLNDENITFELILKKHKGKIIFIDIWATWCKDCIVGMPKIIELQKTYPNVQFVFLSLDREKELWKKGIPKFGIDNGDHYFITKGWKGSSFCDFIDLDWIPRYMIVDPMGKIRMFKATKATDSDIIKHLSLSKSKPTT